MCPTGVGPHDGATQQPAVIAASDPGLRPLVPWVSSVGPGRQPDVSRFRVVVLQMVPAPARGGGTRSHLPGASPTAPAAGRALRVPAGWACGPPFPRRCAVGEEPVMGKQGGSIG